MDIILYYAPVACSLVPYVTLTEAGAKFTVLAVNLRKGQQHTADYLRLNPKHKVPLITVDGRSLSENVAIQLWIGRNVPAAKLLPVDPWQEMQVVSVMSWLASGLHPLLSRMNAASICELPDAAQSIRKIATDGLLECYRIAEGMLAGHDYFFDQFTIADPHFFWCMRRSLQIQVDLSKFSNCMAHFERMQQRTSVRQVFEYEQTVMAEFAAAG